jgi:Uma2 family endonuclease
MSLLLPSETNMVHETIEHEKPMASKNHVRLQRRLTRLLEKFEPKYEAFPELSLELQGKPFIPDISIYPSSPINWQEDVLRESEPPLLAIEILSPKQGLTDLIDKARELTTLGVDEVWVVVPVSEGVIVCPKNSKPRTVGFGAITHTATGISVSIEQLFET